MALRLLKRIAITPPPLAGQPLANTVLAVAHSQQEQTNWCWAACFQMVFAFFGFNITQCNIGNNIFKSNCCKNPGNCNYTLPDLDITVGYNDWDYNVTYIASQLSFGNIQTNINLNQLIEVGLTWSGGGGHVVILNGWSTDSGTQVYINDPAYNLGPGLIDYSFLQSAYGQGTWDATWSGLSPE